MTRCTGAAGAGGGEKTHAAGRSRRPLQRASGMWLTAALTRGAEIQLETRHLFSVRAEKLVCFSFFTPLCVCECVRVRVSVWVGVRYACIELNL